MAEGRMIKKRICKSKKFALLKTDSSRLLYLMMYPHADVKGRLEAEEPLIKGHVLPYLENWNNAKIAECLNDLNRVGLIEWYIIEGNKYLQISRFSDFQTLREDREAESEIPEPPIKNNKQLPDNSGVTQENSPLSLSLSKDKVNIKARYLDFVLLTTEEHQKLVTRLGEDTTKAMIERLNNYIGSKGAKYKSHYHTILNWAAKDGTIDKVADSGADQLRKKFGLRKE